MNITQQDTFLSLLSLGIGKSRDTKIAKEIDWIQLKANADLQGLSAIILDALNKDGTNLPNTMPVQMKLEWIGEVLQNYEGRYAAYEKAIGSLAGFYNQHGYKMMVLKGYASSLDWPNPKHRLCGDIDIWQFGKQKEADALLKNEKGKKIDSSHHHHTVFYWGDFMVENHYDFDNIHARKSNYEIEKYLKELGMDDSRYIDVHNEKVYLPSPNLHALFLLRHMLGHFASSNINLRQVLDWAFFVEKHTKEIDWEWLIDILKRFHMEEFYNTINAICVGDLGFDAKNYPSVQFRPDLKDKVLKDILYPKFSASEPSHLIPRLLYKYRRWQGNAWKQELCYSESRWSAFWNGLWAHLLKPASL